MPIFGSAPYLGPKEVHYLFVDGGALRGRLSNLSIRYFNGATIPLNFDAIARNYTKVFYYDALPVREDGEAEDNYNARVKPQRDIFDAAANVDRVHVYEGDAKRRRKRGLQQKKVDVMLTVDMLTHSFRKNMHRATLLTGDNDFKPLIDALVQDGMFVTLMYPADETSQELMQAADARFALTMLRLHDFLTVEGKRLFAIPERQVLGSSVGTGTHIRGWEQDGEEFGLHKRLDEFIVTKNQKITNDWLHIKHGSLDLLRYFCRESMGIHVPVT
jgi:uncharacterized LabA/DUF88 family protein